MKDFNAIIRFRTTINGSDLHCEKSMPIPFVPQIGMVFCISNVYHEMKVKYVCWSDDPNETELAVVCHDRTHVSSLMDAAGIKADLISEGWAVT